MGKYDDIINLEYRKSTVRPHMSLEDRAAQFSPFKALTGLDEENDEMARITDDAVFIDDNLKNELDAKLGEIILAMSRDDVSKGEIEIEVTYFVPDDKKLGGKYEKKTGNLLKIDEYARSIIMDDRTEIYLDNIRDLQIVQIGQNSSEKSMD